jgi:GNAT superfamily N-acetyltransferase
MIICPLTQYPDFIRTVAIWAFGHWYVNSGIKFSTVEADYQRRSDFSSLPVTWVAVEDSIPVGMVSLKEQDLHTHKHLTPWLSALYVIPSYRKRGIAGNLIDTVIDYADSLGFETVNLFTDNRKGDYLLRYYSRRGWIVSDKTYDQAGKPTNIMTYCINNESELCSEAKQPIVEINRLSKI